MSLQNWLLPNEQIKYSAPDIISYTRAPYQFYITDERIIFYAKFGFWIWTRESVTTERLFDIITMNYEESGILDKIGILQLETANRKIRFGGRPATMQAIWQTLQQYIRRES